MEVHDVVSHAFHDFSELNIVLSVEVFDPDEITEYHLKEHWGHHYFYKAELLEKAIANTLEEAVRDQLKLLYIDRTHGAFGSVLFKGRVEIRELPRNDVSSLIEQVVT